MWLSKKFELIQLTTQKILEKMILLIHKSSGFWIRWFDLTHESSQNHFILIRFMIHMIHMYMSIYILDLA